MTEKQEAEIRGLFNSEDKWALAARCESGELIDDVRILLSALDEARAEADKLAAAVEGLRGSGRNSIAEDIADALEALAEYRKATGKE